jgi:hypothetical protein
MTKDEDIGDWWEIGTRRRKDESPKNPETEANSTKTINTPTSLPKAEYISTKLGAVSTISRFSFDGDVLQVLPPDSAIVLSVRLMMAFLVRVTAPFIIVPVRFYMHALDFVSIISLTVHSFLTQCDEMIEES